jgi:hypothetical protein
LRHSIEHHSKVQENIHACFAASLERWRWLQAGAFRGYFGRAIQSLVIEKR